MEQLRIGDVDIGPGERRNLALPLARLPSGAEIHLPVRVVRGKRPGPTLFVSAAIHGDEINGVEILRRLLAHRRLARLRGTLLAVPVVNVFGFVAHSRYLPDRRDLNRCFPGSESGSVAARLAHLFMTEIASRSTHGVDLHTASFHRANLPQVRVTRDDAAGHELARAFGAPVILESPLRPGSLRCALAEIGVPMLIYEAGEALRFDEWAIRPGVRGLIRVMEVLEMLPRRKHARPRPEPLLTRSSRWIRAPESGVLLPMVALGDTVREGDHIASIEDPLGESHREVLSSIEGVIIGRTRLPLVNEGDAVYHVARVTADGDDVPDPLEDFGVDLQLPFSYDPEPGPGA